MENNIIDFKCKYCGHEKAFKKENILMIYAECLSCHEPTLIESKYEEQEKSTLIITCPYCQSTDTKKISGTERVLSVATLGLFSNKINKSFKCNNCKGTF